MYMLDIWPRYVLYSTYSILKGLCHEMNNFFEDLFYNFFVSYLNEKIKLEVLASSFEITY